MLVTKVKLGGARPGALDLVIAREGEDVVADGVGRAVVLVKSAVGGAIDDVALGQDAAAAFVKVDAQPP